MLCPHCGRPGAKQFKGYCSRVHYKLATRRPVKVRLNCKGCGKILIRNRSAIAPSGNGYCKYCKKPSGEQHPRWKDGQYINAEGYRMVLHEDRYQREHRVIWQEVNRATLLPTGTIHHIDYDKLNNSPENLLLLSNQEHGEFHRLADLGRWKEAGGILRSAGSRQYQYPDGVDRWIERAARGGDTSVRADHREAT